MYDYANMFLCLFSFVLFCWVYNIPMYYVYHIFLRHYKIYTTRTFEHVGFTLCIREARFGQEEVRTHQAAE